MNNPRLEYLREKVRRLPKEPGVYLMRDKSGKIIYIGKAKALRNRVSSYFRSVEKHLEKVYKMVENVYDFETIVTDSEFEALVLECSLIKQYTPKYNILLKDDKGYSYIKVTPPPFSRIQAVLQKQDVSIWGLICPLTWSNRRWMRPIRCLCCPPAVANFLRNSAKDGPA